MGGNRDYFSGINGNWNIIKNFPKLGMEMGTESWECEGMGIRKSFPHISKLNYNGRTGTMRSAAACEKSRRMIP